MYIVSVELNNKFIEQTEPSSHYWRKVKYVPTIVKDCGPRRILPGGQRRQNLNIYTNHALGFLIAASATFLFIFPSFETKMKPSP